MRTNWLRHDSGSDLPAHGDAHPRNALSGERGTVWFDWSECASAAHPFMDVGWFLAFILHPSRDQRPVRQACPNLMPALAEAYLAALALPPEPAITQQLAQAIPLTLLHRAVVYDAQFRHWQGTVAGTQPNYVPYYLRWATKELPRLT